MPRSRREPWVVADRLQGLVQAEPLVERHPLAGVAHEVQVEATCAGGLQAGETRLEVRRQGVGAGTGIDGDEEQRGAVPLQGDIGDVVEPGLCGRRRDVPRLQLVVDQLLYL